MVVDRPAVQICIHYPSGLLCKGEVWLIQHCMGGRGKTGAGGRGKEKEGQEGGMGKEERKDRRDRREG
jgi:hypothetical protein